MVSHVRSSIKLIGGGEGSKNRIQGNYPQVYNINKERKTNIFGIYGSLELGLKTRALKT